MKKLLVIGLLFFPCVNLAMEKEKKEKDDPYLWEPILPSPSDLTQKENIPPSQPVEEERTEEDTPQTLKKFWTECRKLVSPKN